MIGHVKKGIKKFWATATLISLEVLATLIIFTLALGLFVLVARTIFVNKDLYFDEWAFRSLSNYVSESNTTIMQAFSFLGTHYVLIPANLLLVGYFLFFEKHRWYTIKIPVIALSSMLLMFLLKQVFGRQRPLSPLMDAARGLSFPSGHAMVSFSFYGLMVWLVWTNVQRNWLKWSAVVFLSITILLIGISRVYLRVHFASDVLAGFSLGLMWLLISLRVLNYFEKISRKNLPVLAENIGEAPMGNSL